MRFLHSSIKNYLERSEQLFLEKSFYSPVVLSKDLLLFFSTQKDRSFIAFDLSNKHPCFYILKTEKFFESLNQVFVSQLRAISDQFMIVNYELLDNDFVLIFRVAISNNKDEDLLFNFEFFPNHPNLVVTDLKNKVICSFNHSKDGDPKNGSIYKSSINENLFDGEIVFNDELIEKFFLESIQNRRLEKYQDFIKVYESKIKKCRTKIKNIENDKKKAELHENYQQIADNLLISGLDLKQRKSSVTLGGETIELEPSKTISENIQLLYKKVKKSKETIRLVETNLKRANDEIEQYEKILQSLFNAPNEKEADKVVAQYSLNKKREVVLTEFNKPWKVNYQGVYFYFGKNSSQNDYLSFVMKQDRQFTWLHIKDKPGSHVVIASLKPTDDQLLFGAELSLYLSKEKTGEVQYTRKKNIRRGHSLGEAIVKNYSTIKINNIRERSINLFETAKRCN